MESGNWNRFDTMSRRYYRLRWQHLSGYTVYQIYSVITGRTILRVWVYNIV